MPVAGGTEVPSGSDALAPVIGNGRARNPYITSLLAATGMNLLPETLPGSPNCANAVAPKTSDSTCACEGRVMSPWTPKGIRNVITDMLYPLSMKWPGFYEDAPPLRFAQYSRLAALISAAVRGALLTPSEVARRAVTNDNWLFLARANAAAPLNTPTSLVPLDFSIESPTRNCCTLTRPVGVV